MADLKYATLARLNGKMVFIVEYGAEESKVRYLYGKNQEVFTEKNENLKAL